jgi:apolipoprotein N-acyltransferase
MAKRKQSSRPSNTKHTKHKDNPTTGISGPRTLFDFQGKSRTLEQSHLCQESTKARILTGLGYLVAAWVGVALVLYTLTDPNGPQALGFNDTSWLIVLLVTGLYGMWLLTGRGKNWSAVVTTGGTLESSSGVTNPEQGLRGRSAMDALFGISLLGFIFSFFFALTANLDYVQRLQLGNQAINLSVDSSTEQRIAFVRFIPLILAYIWSLIWYRPKNWWVFPSLMITPFIHAYAFPTQLNMDGFGFLILFILVPLFLALDSSKDLPSFFVRGFFWGIFSTMMRNYWLGTYSLVTLQGVALVFTYRYGVFFLVGWPLYGFLRKRNEWFRHLRWVLLAIAFTVFEFWAGHSWVGYPWTLAAHALYQWTPFIQSAAVGGVWMVSFWVYLLNAGLGWAVADRNWKPGAGAVGIFLLIGLIGYLAIPALDPDEGTVATYSEQESIQGGRTVVTPRLTETRKPPSERAVRVSLIQQNEDPRKADYDVSLGTLIRLTELSVRYNPDFIVWSETAFPPNIRHWTSIDPKNSWERFLVSQVQRFIRFQRELGIPLMTGNDNYYEILDDQGMVIDRTSYNAAILFDGQGNRVDTYHKIVLVPLTETFPYRSFLPGFVFNLFPGIEEFFQGILQVLKQLDVNLWGEGDRLVVFDVNGMPFSVPICFEDAFPYHVRDFVLEGARVIVNISNDYWALDEVQAQQHFAAGMFRAVENRVPMVRSTTSGVTGHIDAHGRLLGRIPSYEAGFVVTDVVPAPDDMRPTLYTLWGDWFPRLLVYLMAAYAFGLWVFHLVIRFDLVRFFPWSLKKPNDP